MKRKITHGIILFLAVACVILCGGCSRRNGAESERKPVTPVAETPPESDNALQADAEKDNALQADAENETGQKEDAVLQEELRPAVLQIFCGEYRGSGVVWEITEKEVVVASSGHLLKNGDTCEVLCHAGVYYEAKVEKILENCDIGFAVFAADAPKADGVELTPVTPGERTAEELVQGEELIVYGSKDNVAANFVKGYLIEAEREMQIDGYRSAKPLLLGGIVRQGDTVDAGMSGSGVFDRSGKVLGILAGGDGENGFAAVPVWRITEETGAPGKDS